MKTRVIIESPYQGETEEKIRRNIRYARRCMIDSLNRGEAPLVFHLLYPERAGGVLDDSNPDQRERGMTAAKQWYSQAQIQAVYQDLGITDGMQKHIEEASMQVKFRSLKNSDYAPEEGRELRLPFMNPKDNS